MKFTADISGASLKATNFNLKRSRTADFSLVSNLLYLDIIEDDKPIFIGDTVNFWEGLSLIFTGAITEFSNGTITASSTSAVEYEALSSAHVIFYNKDQIRVPLDFNLAPYKNFVTGKFNIVITSVTHYFSTDYYTEIRYG